MINIDKQEAEEGKVLSIFAYIGILFLVPLLAGGENQFVKFHANQGLVLFLASLAVTVAYVLLSILFSFLGFFGYMLVSLAGTAGSIGILALMIIGIINVVQLEAKPLPIIGGITLIKSY